MKMTAVSLWLWAAMLIGIPKSHAQAQLPVRFEPVDVHEHCFILYRLIGVPESERSKGQPYVPEKLVINTKRAYDAFQRALDMVRNLACKEVNFPSINFAQKTLLVNWASGSCAAFGFTRTAFEDPEKKEIIYSVKVRRRNIGCSGPGLQSLNLIAIPKLQIGYSVKFKSATGMPHIGSN